MCLLAMNSLYNEKGQWLVPLVWRKNIHTVCFKDNIILQRENLNHLIVCFTQCLFNMFGICTVGNCVSLLQGFWEHKSGIKYPPTRTFFLTCFLHTLNRSQGKYSRRLACLCSLVLCADCNFESKQAISKTLFWQCPNNEYLLNYI